MLLIDRYLLFQFVKSFLIFFISFTGLYVVIDLFNNLDEFLKYGEATGSLFGVLLSYYGPRVFSFFNMTSGILTLTAAMFTVTWFQRHNEMTALMAAGISKARIVRPLILAVVFIALLGVVNREFVVPQFTDRLGRNAQDWLGERAKDLRPKYDNERVILINGKSTFANEMRILEPSFRLPKSFPVVKNRLTALNAYYRPAEDNRPSGYLLDQVTEVEGLEKISSLKDGEQILVLMPGDTPWLEPNQCFVVSNLTFEQLTASREWRSYASTFSLISALSNPSLDFGADTLVEIHGRMVQPFLDIVLLLIGLPLVLRDENRNVFLAIGWCLLTVMIFFMVNLACRGLGANYMMDPALAVWIPLMLFVPVAVAMGAPLRDDTPREHTA